MLVDGIPMGYCFGTVWRWIRTAMQQKRQIQNRYATEDRLRWINAIFQCSFDAFSEITFEFE